VGILEDRGKGLEEEYFHHKNQEAIEKLRQKMAIAKQAKSGWRVFNAVPAVRRYAQRELFRWRAYRHMHEVLRRLAGRERAGTSGETQQQQLA
jgi:hypothetical protein